MTGEILKVKKRFGYPPDLEETPLVHFFNLRNSKLLVFGCMLSNLFDKKILKKNILKNKYLLSQQVTF